MKKNLLLLGLTVLSFQAYAQTSSVQVANKAIASAEMQAEIQEALILQESSRLQSTQRVMEGATYVGSFQTNDGPYWTTNPDVYSGIEAAALLFGGNSSDYAISTNSNITDPTTITHTAWASTWGLSGCQEVAEDYSLDLGNPGYNDPGGANTATSSYVYDNCTSNNINHVWLVNETIEPEPCAIPYDVVLTRTSPTTASFNAGNSVWHYQGSANRAGRPLRPYPMYGMNDMTVPHNQSNLVPSFAYDVWLRTICANDTFSDWAGPFRLPIYTADMEKTSAMTLSPNPAISMVRIDKIDAKLVEVYDMRGVYIKTLYPQNNQIDLTGLSIGKYNLKVIDREGNAHLDQVIKK